MVQGLPAICLHVEKDQPASAPHAWIHAINLLARQHVVINLHAVIINPAHSPAHPHAEIIPRARDMILAWLRLVSGHVSDLLAA